MRVTQFYRLASKEQDSVIRLFHPFEQFETSICVRFSVFMTRNGEILKSRSYLVHTIEFAQQPNLHNACVIFAKITKSSKSLW